MRLEALAVFVRHVVKPISHEDLIRFVERKRDYALRDTTNDLVRAELIVFFRNDVAAIENKREVRNSIVDDERYETNMPVSKNRFSFSIVFPDKTIIQSGFGKKFGLVRHVLGNTEKLVRECLLVAGHWLASINFNPYRSTGCPGTHFLGV